MIWGLAVVGVIVTLCWLDAPRILTTMFYVGMGWIAVLVLQPLAAALSASAFFWMIAGGVAYTCLLYTSYYNCGPAGRGAFSFCASGRGHRA